MAGSPVWGFSSGLTEFEVLTFEEPMRKTVKWQQDQSQRSKHFALVHAEHAPPFSFLVLVKNCPHCVLKHLLHAAVTQGGALQVALSLNLTSHTFALSRRDAAAPMNPHLPQVRLSGHDQHRHPGKVLSDLGYPLALDAGKRVGVGHRVAHEDDVCLLVRSRPDLLEVVVARRVPQPEADLDTVHVHLNSRVFKDGGLVRIWKGLRGEADKQGRLANRAVPNQNTLYG